MAELTHCILNLDIAHFDVALPCRAYVAVAPLDEGDVRVRAASSPLFRVAGVSATRFGNRRHTAATVETTDSAQAFRRACDSQPRDRSGSAVWCPALRRCAPVVRFRRWPARRPFHVNDPAKAASGQTERPAKSPKTAVWPRITPRTGQFGTVSELKPTHTLDGSLRKLRQAMDHRHEYRAEPLSSGAKTIMKTKTWTVISNTGKQADLESGLEKKEFQKPTHITSREFAHWLAAASRIDDNALQSLFKR